jgi:sugar phosphate isomerase/epimerase
MKFALNAAGGWSGDFAAIARLAADAGFDAVELGASVHDTFPSCGNVFLSDPNPIREKMKSAGVSIAALCGYVGLPGPTVFDSRFAEEIEQLIRTTRQLECGQLRLADFQFRPGRNMIDWFTRLGDLAEALGVTILVTNGAGFGNAVGLWTLLERIDHPAIAACWDVGQALRDGESPERSVPTLNQKIRHLLVPMDMSEEIMDRVVTRLMGIGFGGFLSLESSAQPTAAHLAGAMNKLRRGNLVGIA